MTRIAAAVAVTVMLSLVFSVSYAAWTAPSSTSALVATATIGLSSSGISALGPHAYTAVNTPLIRSVTLSNPGSVSLPLTALTVASTGTLDGANVMLTAWVRSGATCPTSTPGAVTPKFVASLASGTTAIGAGFHSVPAGRSSAICIATTLIGSLSSLAGTSITPTLTLSGAVPPSAVTCSPGAGYVNCG